MAKDFREEAVSILNVLRSSKRVEVIEIGGKLFDKGLEVYGRYSDKAWGLVDCISFVVMQENEVTEALTFDGDFTQAGFIAVSG